MVVLWLLIQRKKKILLICIEYVPNPFDKSRYNLIDYHLREFEIYNIYISSRLRNGPFGNG